MKKVLIFGVTGSIGKYCYDSFNSKEYLVYGTTSKKDNENISKNIILVANENITNLLNIDNIDIIIWCQGSNINDNINSFDEKTFKEIIDVNLIFTIKTLNFLLKNKKINENSKMVVLSSIWEKISKKNKLSYSVSKAALSGFIKSVSYELSEYKILINNVLPGVIDNEMTKRTLSINELKNITEFNNFNRMVSLEDVFNTIYFLVVENTGITGQSIVVDLGFSVIKKI